MDNIVKQDNLKRTYILVDNVIICEHNYADHDKNLKKFIDSKAK